MTIRERMLATLRGGEADRIPWSIYPIYLRGTAAEQRLRSKGLGVKAWRRIFRTAYDDVTITRERRAGGGQHDVQVRIETPAGTLTQESVTDATTGSRWIRKHFITGLDDYAAAEFFFHHTRFEPDYEPWLQADAEMGDAGIVTAEIMPVPIMHLWVEWMGIEQMVEGAYLHSDRFDALVDVLDRHYDRQIQLAAESPAELVWFPDNITASVISPRLFERYCAPVYARAMPVMRSSGKIPYAHYDGSVRPLVDFLAKTDLPVMEAFTPPPMGDLTVAEAKKAWPDKVIWINFPGSLFLQPAEEIEVYTLDLLREGAPGGRLMVGCTEDFPLGEFEKTFAAIGRALAEYEGYAW